MNQTQKRVVITGMGIVSCIGNDKDTVLAALKAGKSGITFSPEYAEMGFRSQVYGKPDINLEEKIDKRLWRFMGDGAAFNHIAMEQAVKDSGLEESEVSQQPGDGAGREWPDGRSVSPAESAQLGRCGPLQPGLHVDRSRQASRSDESFATGPASRA